MSSPNSPLDLTLDGGTLTARLVDFPSVSGEETALADAVEAALRAHPHLTVDRFGNNVVARTHFGLPERVVLAGHLDTVPIADNVPSHVEGDLLYGCGTSDMKSGVAVQLRLAATVVEPNHDITYVFYDCEEVEADRNGLGHLFATHPDWLAGDFAVLMEPSGAVVEGGCQGSLRADITLTGVRAHAARSWLGDNAIHKAAEVLRRLAEYEPRRVVIDGLEYREGLNATRIDGGVAGNVIPDECRIHVAFRFAPDRSLEQAEAHLREVFDGYQLDVVDASPAALPGLSQPAAQAFLAAVGGEPRAKFGWTDVARFSAHGVPAVNYGPGDPNLAHKREEHCSLSAIAEVEERLRNWLTK
ncbi:succinyl-diaminopimelate desuccinylase [Kitasatospora cheerisanensis]|uniref:Succinyl-diaminopimelate desuccinylase n=1 Tax=Kitasatospora cheerisanensis KCTC 2395 TaxID=1348663 RepID=A0A066YZ14_9ACTN|nr:succinyl-diaminopimelate desuccinylase [Kitasatospora cheerisanensis]KDN83331.1 succinyl-diaminopimelate desuccinylase [Kitasatospora cheerisanensis KCTC 2395]